MEPVKLTHNGFNKIPKKSHYENQQKIMYIYFFWKKNIFEIMEVYGSDHSNHMGMGVLLFGH